MVFDQTSEFISFPGTVSRGFGPGGGPARFPSKWTKMSLSTIRSRAARRRATLSRAFTERLPRGSWHCRHCLTRIRDIRPIYLQNRASGEPSVFVEKVA